MTDWSAEKIDDRKWRMWANDLYYILEDMTKENATVVVRNSVITNAGDHIIEQDGSRAWRSLKVAMNPKTPARRLQSFMEVVQCGGGERQAGDQHSHQQLASEGGQVTNGDQGESVGKLEDSFADINVA